MEIIKLFKGKTVYLDTAPLIYLIENHPLYKEAINLIFQANKQGDFKFISSVLTLTEVLAQPLHKKETALAGKYESILRESENILLVDFKLNEAKEAASIRSRYHLTMPDAVHLATAIENKADYFLTNDKALSKIKSIEIILLSNV